MFPALGAVGWALPSRKTAANFPSKPIRLVLPYPPGGGSDTIGRPLAHRLGENLKQQVIFDNRGGAGGNIGMEIVAKKRRPTATRSYWR